MTPRSSDKSRSAHGPSKSVWRAISRIGGAYSVPLVAGFVCLSVYTITLAPTVTSEDSGELIAAAHCFGVPHPPGYPLWTMLCGAFIRVFAIGSVAWRANLLSAVCAAGAIAVLGRCIQHLGASSSAASWSEGIETGEELAIP